MASDDPHTRLHIGDFDAPPAPYRTEADIAHPNTCIATKITVTKF